MSKVKRSGVVAVAALLAMTSVACSGSDDGDETSDGTTPTDQTTGGTGGAAGGTCEQAPTMEDIEAVPVDGVEHDFTVTSFDGTNLRVHWFPVEGASADAPAPTVLKGPGWSLAGDTALDPDAVVILSGSSIPELHDAGYNVLTWDPRGFGESEGVVQINSAEAEGRDAQVLLDWVATQPEAQVDREGDPRVGMVGFSYGGGIQLVTAALDCRVDAIVPGIAWNSLETSLYKNETAKVGWATFLARIGATAGELDPHITSAAEDAPTGVLDEEDLEWFRGRGPDEVVGQITAPTLFVQGTVDTLFTLQEAVTNHDILAANGVPTAMVWFCGGHGACSSHEGDLSFGSQATRDWLDRYVKGDETVEVVTGVTFVDQDGNNWHLDGLDLAEGTIQASGSGTLELTAEGGAGPIVLEETDDPLAGLVPEFTTAPADNAVEVRVEAEDVERLVVGAPTLSLTYSGTVAEGEGITRVFAQLVDDETDLVLGDHVTPIAVELDGASHTVEVDLEVVAHLLKPGATLRLQIVATTVAYAQPRLGGSIELEEIQLMLPTTEKATRVEP